jgi:hypothetical protein
LGRPTFLGGTQELGGFGSSGCGIGSLFCGSFGEGGTGQPPYFPAAGGGGGGWYGGGTDTESSSGLGGGGGSGYYSPFALSGSFPGGTHYGNGLVIVRK